MPLLRPDRRRPRRPRRRRHREGGHAAERLDRPLRHVGGQRLAVPAILVLDLGHALALDRARQDDRRPLRPLGELVGVVDLRRVVPVDDHGAAAERLDAPPVGFHVPAELGRAGLTQPVHVDDRRQVVEAVVRRLVESLPDGALGQLAVAAEHPDPVVKPVEALAGEGYADAVGQALTQRPGGHVDPREHGGRVSLKRGPGPPVGLHELAVADHAGCLEQRVEQRRGVSLGEDEVVVVRPVRPGPVVVQVAGEQHRHQVGRGEARGRVAGAGSGHAADAVHAQLSGELPGGLEVRPAGHPGEERSSSISSSSSSFAGRLRRSRLLVTFPRGVAATQARSWRPRVRARRRWRVCRAPDGAGQDQTGGAAGPSSARAARLKTSGGRLDDRWRRSTQGHRGTRTPPGSPISTPRACRRRGSSSTTPRG